MFYTYIHISVVNFVCTNMDSFAKCHYLIFLEELGKSVSFCLRNWQRSPISRNSSTTHSGSSSVKMPKTCTTFGSRNVHKSRTSSRKSVLQIKKYNTHPTWLRIVVLRNKWKLKKKIVQQNIYRSTHTRILPPHCAVYLLVFVRSISQEMLHSNKLLFTTNSALIKLSYKYL